MNDKTQLGILKAVISNITLKGIISGVMFGAVIGVILGVTTGHLSTGIWGGVSMAIAGAIGFNIMIIRKLK